jgi:hypothetical protein
MPAIHQHRGNKNIHIDLIQLDETISIDDLEPPATEGLVI